MGCGWSKLEPIEDIPNTYQPTCNQLQKRREVQDKKDSSFSTAGLLGSLTLDIVNNFRSSKKGEEDKGRLASMKDKKEGEEEFPGSPSFRIYFEKSEWFDEDDSIKAREEKDHGKFNKVMGEDNMQQEDDNNKYLNSIEECENKLPKKDKGQRFKILMKRLNGVHNNTNDR